LRAIWPVLSPSLARQTDARFVHSPSDYVFDGVAGRPYTEEDPTHLLDAVKSYGEDIEL
jgi:dTDP-4-dehydrorhamnose reductase